MALQPRQQVAAEAPVADGGFEVDVGRGDHARIHAQRAVAADLAHFAGLDRAQQLGLDRERHVADLVEQQRAALRFDEQPVARAHGAAERALHVAEELAVRDRLRERGAVDRHERAAPAC